MASYMKDNPWMYGVIAVGFICIVAFIWLIWHLKKRSLTFNSTEEENSSLLSTHSLVTKFSLLPDFGGLEHALMSCQLYIREKAGMQLLQAFNETDKWMNDGVEKPKSTFWFSVKYDNMMKQARQNLILRKRKDLCVVKVMCNTHLNSQKADSIAGTFLDILLTIKDEVSAYIWPVLDLKYISDRESLVVLTEFATQGSLRDRMLGVKPFSRLRKNQRKKKSYNFGKPLSLQKIRIYSKQILFGLMFLDKLGFPLRKTHAWLHAGSVLLEQDVCRLSGYEVELVLLSLDVRENAPRTGLNSVAQIIFEMSSGFPVNYAEGMILEQPYRGLTLEKSDALQPIHFEYLEQCGKHEIVQVLQFISDEEKCASLHMAIHHPFFDQVTKSCYTEPEPAAVMSLNTLMGQLYKKMKGKKRSSKIADPSTSPKEMTSGTSVTKI